MKADTQSLHKVLVRIGSKVIYHQDEKAKFIINCDEKKVGFFYFDFTFLYTINMQINAQSSGYPD